MQISIPGMDIGADDVHNMPQTPFLHFPDDNSTASASTEFGSIRKRLFLSRKSSGKLHSVLVSLNLFGHSLVLGDYAMPCLLLERPTTKIK